MARVHGRNPDESEIGNLYFAADPGDFLVWNVRPADGCLDIYMCATGDLGQMNLTCFHIRREQGFIKRAAHISEITPCPRCGGLLTVVRNGTIGKAPTPFIACTGCAFSEELFESGFFGN